MTGYLTTPGPDDDQPAKPGGLLLYLMCIEYDPCGEWDPFEERPVCGFPLAEGPCPNHGTTLD
ncbi:hypothetical protein [Actinomadura hibisca]|uniref:hypothetical protein n=1 Tax=Actinomadura hibisca TaxID=68565 RepID=UPI0008363FDA|nr:hypothetical protein [Actinomadura hibisca]